MPEWLVEEGIGETRAALVDEGRIVETRIELDGTIPAGTVLSAKLVDNGTSGRNGVARDEGGTEYLLPHVPREITEGAALNIEITRPAIPGPEPWKRPLAKATDDSPQSTRSFAERLHAPGAPVRKLTLPAARDELGEAGWNELIDEARSGRVDFAGGTLGLFFTPAMTLIDVDGHLAPPELAAAGAVAAAAAILRHGIGGSAGIDLPTVAGKAHRQAVGEALDEILPQPFERTGMNGFGFVQIVRPRRQPSLLELAEDRPAFEARALLRRAAFCGSGPKRLVAGPAVIAVLEGKREWTEALARQIGGAVTLRRDRSLPIHSAYVEKG